jgi:hypothetical protein
MVFRLIRFKEISPDWRLMDSRKNPPTPLLENSLEVIASAGENLIVTEEKVEM